MPATFLNLPGELRNSIYEHYLADYRVEIIALHHAPTEHWLPPALSRVSRQIRTELLSIYEDAAEQPNTWDAHILKVYVDDFDFSYVRDFLGNQVNRGHCITDVEVTFRFTDASHLVRHPKAFREWQAIDFTPVSGRWRSNGHCALCRSQMDPIRLPPRVTCKAQLDFASLGSGARVWCSKKRVAIRPSSKLFDEIVRRAKEVVYDRPGGRGARERSFRTWLKLELLDLGDKRRTTAFDRQKSISPRSTHK